MASTKCNFIDPVQEYWLWIRINLHTQKARNGPVFLVCIFGLKFYAFSDNDNFDDNLTIQIFYIDNLPTIWKMPIYRLSIIIFNTPTYTSPNKVRLDFCGTAVSNCESKSLKFWNVKRLLATFGARCITHDRHLLKQGGCEMSIHQTLISEIEEL